MTNYYKCVLCNYKTKDSGNLSHHNKTKKHLTKLSEQQLTNLNAPKCTLNAPKNELKNEKHKLDKKFICNYCNTSFTRSNSLSRHKNICSEKQKEEIILRERVKELSLQLEVSNTKVNHYKHIEEEAKYYKQMLMEAGGLVKKSVSALTYSITNYEDAPSIKTIEIKDVETFNNPDKDIVEDVLSAYKHKTLCKYLGQLILKLYKKGNPLDQSIWNTDDNRLTYIIKELLNNNSSNWIVDKKGVKTIEYLINPLLLYIKKLIIEYQKSDIPTHNQTIVEMELMLENGKVMVAIINGIDDDVIAKDVLKYISAHLRFDDKNLKLK